MLRIILFCGVSCCHLWVDYSEPKFIPSQVLVHPGCNFASVRLRLPPSSEISNSIISLRARGAHSPIQIQTVIHTSAAHQQFKQPRRESGPCHLSDETLKKTSAHRCIAHRRFVHPPRPSGCALFYSPPSLITTCSTGASVVRRRHALRLSSGAEIHYSPAYMRLMQNARSVHLCRPRSD